MSGSVYRIRKIEGRGSRGKSGVSLKLGKKYIQSLSEQQTGVLIQKMRSRIVGDYSRSIYDKPQTKAHRKSLKKISKTHQAKKKYYQKLHRTITLLRRQSKQNANVQGRKDSVLLDSVYPKRRSSWKAVLNRKQIKTISIKGFSFIDDPKGTYLKLREVVEAESKSKRVFIDFDDVYCHDIAPYMVLALMRDQMINIFAGGRIRQGIYSALNAVNLLDMLRISTSFNANDPHILPFKIRSRRKTGSSVNDNLATSEGTEEKTAAHFADSFNDWLGNLKNPLQLTDDAYVNYATLFGELLDNAKRHSDILRSDGAWHVSGFMEIVPGGKNQKASCEAEYICNFSIISLGNTIYESLQTAPKNIVDAIDLYCKQHKSSNLSEECLWNVCALQDGISRIHQKEQDDPNGGYGMMQSLISLMKFFGCSDNKSVSPQMTIISGKSCIMVKNPYTSPIQNKNGYNVLGFNDENSLDKPPNTDHVFDLPGVFPGTIITVRFPMDSDDLIEKADKENETT